MNTYNNRLKESLLSIASRAEVSAQNRKHPTILVRKFLTFAFSTNKFNSFTV